MRTISGAVAACALVLTALAVPAAEARPASAPFRETLLREPGTDEEGTVADSWLGVTYTASTTLESGVRSAPRDMVVSAVDAEGQVLWTQTVGTAQQDVAADVAAGWWGVLVLSRVSDDPYAVDTVGAAVRLFDRDGTLVWARRHDERAPVRAIAARGGSYYLVGGDERTGEGRFSVRRYALADGSLRAEKGGFINPGVNSWSEVAVVDRDIVVAGTSSASGVDQAVVRRLDGQTLEQEWHRTVDTSGYDGAEGLAVRDGRVLLSGLTSGRLGHQRAYGQTDVWLASFGAWTGERRWVRQLGTDANDYASTVTGTPSGPVVVYGSFSYWGDTAGMRMVRYDRGGTLVATHPLGDPYPPLSVGGLDWDWGSLVVAGSDWNDVDAPDRDVDSFVWRYDLGA